MGCGSLGSNLVANLSCDLRNQANITVLDYDTVEKRNVEFGTQFYMRDQVGMSKVEALQYNVYKWYGRKIDIIEKKYLGDGSVSEFWGYDLIIDCFDNHEARSKIQINARFSSKRMYLLHVGFSDQFTFAIEWSDNYTVPSDSISDWDICEAQGAASWIKMVSGLASLTVQQFVSKTEKLEFIGNKFTIRQIT